MIEHHRWWVACDFAFETRSQQSFDAALVREIAKAYGVVRGFGGRVPPSPTTDHIGERIGNAVSRVAGMPSVSLMERYVLLQEALNELQVPYAAGPAIRYDLISGLSKLLWFALRCDWTMFDDLAARAVNARGSANNRGQLFYFKLEKAGFRDVVSRLNAWITELDPALHRLRGGAGY